MEIREVRRTEYEEAGRVTASAYREVVPPDAGQDLAEYLELIADIRGRADRTVVLVAVEEGRLLGSATLELDRPIGDEGDHTAEPMVVARAMYERIGFIREPARDHLLSEGGMLQAHRLSWNPWPDTPPTGAGCPLRR
jgi:hypothetical protein